MKKKLFTLLVCAFAVVSANAFTVSSSGTTVTIDCGDTGLPQNFSDFGDDRQTILEALTLIVKGNVGQYDLSCFEQGKGVTRDSDGGKGFKATTVDFGNAYFQETENGAGPFEFYEYAPNSSETPKYKVVKTMSADGENATVTYVEDSKGKYVKRSNVYYKTNKMTFQYFFNVNNPIISTHVESLCQNCFNNLQNLNTFTIPDNIIFLGEGCVDNTGITSMNIPAFVEYIQKGAVKNGDTKRLIDVTVNSISTVCAPGGFLKDITVGQTDAGYGNFAVLHFPEGEEAAEYFTNQDHVLDLPTSLDYGKFHTWLSGHYNSAGNGWQEFTNSSPSSSEEIPMDKPVVLRTFSDNVAHYVPLCYRAYIVNGIEGDNTNGYTLKLQETYAIPANTGVILYGEAITGSLALPILSGNSWNNNPYNRESGTVKVDNNTTVDLKNYLVANCTLKAGTKIGPYELSADKKSVAERNFIMSRYGKTDLFTEKFPSGDPDEYTDDYIAFFRAKSMTPGKNKAHLKLPSSMFNEPKGAEILVLNQNDFRSDVWNNPYLSTGNWGEKSSSIPHFQAKSFGEPFEDEYGTNGINNVNGENIDDSAIYNLQGVKVSNPVKGVYVKAGKKIIIK